MNQVTSKDGTRIAYSKAGQGEPLVLIDGAMCHRKFGPNEALAARLAEFFTVYTFDRRGRGESGEQLPYALEREIEDIGAVIAEAGGSACVYGISSGGALALEAANRLRSIRKVAVYEAPFVVDGSRPPVPDDYLDNMRELIVTDRRNDAIRYFFRTGIGLNPVIVAMMRLMPAWKNMKAIVHTLLYDTLFTVDLQRGKPLPQGKWSAATMPALVVDGSKSPAWMRAGMAALADALPAAEYRTLAGQTHIVKAEALAPVLREFFAG